MSLITCPECEDRLSTHAELCPHCGYPYAHRRFLKIMFMTILTAVVAIGTAIAARRHRGEPRVVRAPTRKARPSAAPHWWVLEWK